MGVVGRDVTADSGCTITSAIHSTMDQNSDVIESSTAHVQWDQ